MFENRKLLIATKHGKEKVIAPILEKELKVKCFTSNIFDTDTLGTFCGEIERKLGPIDTVRQKCVLAMEAASCDLGVASEGSFGPHPTIPFIPANEEFLIFIDKKNNLEIIVNELSTDTNYTGSEIKTKKELLSLAKQIKFPNHALIIKNKKDRFTDIVKGITNKGNLLENFEYFKKKYGEMFVETDMRAMYNPTRMVVIEKSANKLVSKINSKCPQCITPGFGITEAKPGLPCENCNFPTRSTLMHIWQCHHCKFEEKQKFPNDKTYEDPMYCDFCNP